MEFTPRTLIFIALHVIIKLIGFFHIVNTSGTRQLNNYSVPMQRPIVKLVIIPFQIKAELAEHAACGGFEGSFRGGVELSARTLDEFGFVVNNIAFIRECKARFQGAMFKASCEELCFGLIRIAHDMMGERLVEAKATVINLTGHLEAVWMEGQKVPPFPRLATDEEKKATLSTQP
jgi:hypothetical protein